MIELVTSVVGDSLNLLLRVVVERTGTGDMTGKVVVGSNGEGILGNNRIVGKGDILGNACVGVIVLTTHSGAVQFKVGASSGIVDAVIYSDSNIGVVIIFCSGIIGNTIDLEFHLVCGSSRDGDDGHSVLLSLKGGCDVDIISDEKCARVGGGIILPLHKAVVGIGLSLDCKLGAIRIGGCERIVILISDAAVGGSSRDGAVLRMEFQADGKVDVILELPNLVADLDNVRTVLHNRKTRAGIGPFSGRNVVVGVGHGGDNVVVAILRRCPRATEVVVHRDCHLAIRQHWQQHKRQQCKSLYNLFHVLFVN